LLVAETECAGHRTSCSLADEDRSLFRVLLKARRGVHRVAGDEKVASGRLARGHHLAGVHADAKTQRGGQWVRGHTLPQCQRRGERAVGIVAVSLWDPEHRHDRVADELLQRASVLGDDLARDLVIAAEDGADVLGITGFAHGGGPRNVGEDHGHDATLLGHSGILPPYSGGDVRPAIAHP
jgi:hypothetical protein